VRLNIEVEVGAKVGTEVLTTAGVLVAGTGVLVAGTGVLVGSTVLVDVGKALLTVVGLESPQATSKTITKTIPKIVPTHLIGVRLDSIAHSFVW
jgi:hypothetical protein